MGSIESFWVKQGLYPSIPNFLSENNLKNCSGFDQDPCNGGGNMVMATAYLSRQSGPVSINNDPYETYDDGCKPYFNPVGYITEARFLPQPANNNFIKQELITYGALYAEMWWDDNAYNPSNYTYYCNWQDVQYSDCNCGGHAVVVAGWDDNIETAGGQGAWICKNSWGTNWGDQTLATSPYSNGYFYISYNDEYLFNVNKGYNYGYFPGRIDYNTNSNVYCIAKTGPETSVGCGNDNGIAYGLIKYQAEEDNQYLTKVGLWINTANTIITVNIYHDFDGTKPHK